MQPIFSVAALYETGNSPGSHIYGEQAVTDAEADFRFRIDENKLSYMETIAETLS